MNCRHSSRNVYYCPSLRSAGSRCHNVDIFSFRGLYDLETIVVQPTTVLLGRRCASECVRLCDPRVACETVYRVRVRRGPINMKMIIVAGCHLPSTATKIAVRTIIAALVVLRAQGQRTFVALKCSRSTCYALENPMP